MVFNDQFAKVLKKQGFTLLELLIAVALLAFIFSLGPFINVKVLKDYQISQEASYLESNLRLVQRLSLQQKNDSSFGIKFFENKYFLFERPSFEKKVEIFQAHQLPKDFKIEGPSEIVFEKATAKPSFVGIIRILLLDKENIVLNKREIDLNSVGNIEILK